MTHIKEEEDGGGVGCCGIGIPNVFHPTVSRKESTFCPEAKQEGSVVDDHMISLSFGPPTEDEFGVAGQTEEEE